MRSSRNGHLLMHNTMRVKEGHLEAFSQAIDRAVEFVEEHGPQIMVQVFIDEDAMVAHSFQLYPDSTAIRRHWSLSDPYIREVMEHCEVERFEMYGEPDESVAQRLRPLSTDEGPWSAVPRRIGFLRTREEDTRQVGSPA